MVKSLYQPPNLKEAARLLDSLPEARPLAGGTFLLSGQFRDRPLVLVDLGPLLPARINRHGVAIEMGAAVTFQDILTGPDCPALLRTAAGHMGNRNIRNRATIGGNIGSCKSCASLVPALLASEALLGLAGGGLADLGDWLERPSGIIERILLNDAPGWKTAAGRWARTANDIGLLSVAVCLQLRGRKIAGIRVAAGGLGHLPRRFGEIETALTGLNVPASQTDRGELEALIAPLLAPKGDLRGSAAFKRHLAAWLIVSTLLEAAS